MKTLIIKCTNFSGKVPNVFWLLPLLLGVWLLAPTIIHLFSPLAGVIDPGIWQLILLGFICWIMGLLLAGWLIQYVFKKIVLPFLQPQFGPFNQLQLWQQYALYLAFYALLVLSAVGSLIAIC